MMLTQSSARTSLLTTVELQLPSQLKSFAQPGLLSPLFAALISTFMVVIISYVMAVFFAASRPKANKPILDRDQDALDGTPIVSSAIEGTPFEELPLVIIRHKIAVWAKVGTAGVISMIVLTAALYLIMYGESLTETQSQYSIVLSGLTYLSTYLVYKMWMKMRE